VSWHPGKINLQWQGAASCLFIFLSWLQEVWEVGCSMLWWYSRKKSISSGKEQHHVLASKE